MQEQRGKPNQTKTKTNQKNKMFVSYGKWCKEQRLATLKKFWKTENRLDKSQSLLTKSLNQHQTKKKKKKSVDGFPPVSSRKTENLLEGLGQCLKGDAKKTVSTALSSCIALYNTPHFDWLREVLSLRPHLAHDDKKWVFFLTTTSHCQ